jgi:Fe-S cluster biosynthesis and repair protein YggX
MSKKIFCQKCKKEINKDEVYIPQTEGKYKFRKLCKDCFFRVLNSNWNENGKIEGSRK